MSHADTNAGTPVQTPAQLIAAERSLAATATYEQHRDTLKTGDIVLFGGKGGLSEWIKYFTRSPWSHVGMIVRLHTWDMVLLWESTTLSSIKDVDSGEARQGVQLVGFRERLDTYRGDVAIRRLSVSIDDEQRYALGQLRSILAERPYERSKLQLMRSAYDGPGGRNCQDLSSIFCSELTAEAYMAMGLLRRDLPSSEYTPADWSTEARQPLPLSAGIELSPEIYLRREA